MKNICCLPCISRLVPGKVSFVTLKGSNRKGGCFGKLVLTHACYIARVSFHTRVFSHISVSNSSLLWTKALACKTISTMTLFVLLITYAHIWEIGDTLSVPCHHMCARAFTFFPTFPWRVTNGSHKSDMEIVEKMISLVLYDTNRSFKRQNTVSLKTGVFIKVSEMRRLH